MSQKVGNVSATPLVLQVSTSDSDRLLSGGLLAFSNYGIKENLFFVAARYPTKPRSHHPLIQLDPQYNHSYFLKSGLRVKIIAQSAVIVPTRGRRGCAPKRWPTSGANGPKLGHESRSHDPQLFAEKSRGMPKSKAD